MIRLNEAISRVKSFFIKKGSIKFLPEKTVQSIDISLPLKPDRRVSNDKIKKLIVSNPWCSLEEPVSVKILGSDNNRELHIRFSALTGSKGEEIINVIRQMLNDGSRTQP